MFGPVGLGLGVKPLKPQRRPFMEVFQDVIKTIATSSLFTSFIMFIIGVNAISIGLETVEGLKDTHGDMFNILDHLFLAIYTAEFFIKVYADSRGYWKSAYNIFDFVILALSYVQVVMNQLEVGDNILGVFTLLRALRTLRTISFIEGLQVLVTALIDTIRNSVLNVVILLALLMLFFGVVGYYIFGYDDSGDKERWGTLNNAMLTLFTFVTADGWTDIQKRLAENYPGSQWFTVVFIFLGHFIFTNLFIGIIIMNIHEATERFLQAQRAEKETQLTLKKEYLYKRQHDDVRQMLEKQKTSQYTNFEEMTKSFSETLRHDDYVIMKDVCANLLWLETYIDSLDHLDVYMYRTQQGHRNLALVLSEMAERHYKKQYGLLLADDLQDAYIPYHSERKSHTVPDLWLEPQDKKDVIIDTSSKSKKRKISFDKVRRKSAPIINYGVTTIAPVASAILEVPCPDPSTISLHPHQVPSIFVVNEDTQTSVVSNRIKGNVFNDIIEEEEDFNEGEQEFNGEGEKERERGIEDNIIMDYDNEQSNSQNPCLTTMPSAKKVLEKVEGEGESVEANNISEKSNREEEDIHELKNK